MSDRPLPAGGPKLDTLQVNGIRMRVAQQGVGPLVLMCHGWPESWYSWRHQLAALAAAGYRAVAPDMRGYGGTEAPLEIERYTQLHLVGDMVELVRALGERQAVIVGHDWGAPVAWHAALLRPDVFRAVVGMSVPFAPPGRVDFLGALAEQGVSNFYMQYFQAPGVAEAELQRDVESSIRRILYGGSGSRPGQVVFGMLRGPGLLDNTVDPPTLPGWLMPADVAYFAGEFQRAGFRGGLNWYRTMTRSWELLAPWRGRTIGQPSLFIAGSRDDVLTFPTSAAQIDRFGRTLPGLRGCHLLEGAGHWVQQERPAEVNAMLLEFLQGL